MDRAMQLQTAGRLDEAESIYRQVLAEYPNYADALHLLGAITHQRGHHQEAADLIGQAIVREPSVAMFHSNLGLVLMAQGKNEAAIESLQQAIELKPDHADAYFNLGLAYQLQNDFPKAAENYRLAVQYQPNHADALNNLGAILMEMGQIEEAVAALQGAIRCRPGMAEAYSNLGKLLYEQGRIDSSLTACQTAVQLSPNLAEAHNNLANALRKLGHLDPAATSYQRAIVLKPDYAEGYSNLGCTLVEQGRLDDSIPYFRQAIALRPQIPYFHNNLIFTMLFQPGVTPVQIAQELVNWRQQHADPLASEIEVHTNERTPDRPLRVGFISPEFRDQCQSFFTLPLFAHHNRSQFHYTCYDDSLRPDEATERLKGTVDGWQRITGIDDASVAELVRQDQIDILVDLTLHMERSRLLVFARKPAPVQVTWLGYPGSTGLKTMDYRISDPYLDPVGEDESIYTEQTVRLPETFWCYDPWCTDLKPQSPPVTRGAALTFGSLNNFVKTNPSTLQLWAKVMNGVEGSRLVMLCPSGDQRQTVLNVLGAVGIAPQRVLFTPKIPRRKYLELHHQIDIILDTYPYNGHTTTIDSLWMGVPVVSMAGERVVSRGGWSVLSNVGLPELVARSPVQFVEIATELAKDHSRLADIRSSMRQRIENSPLMDGPRFARNMESAFRTMWRRWCG